MASRIGQAHPDLSFQVAEFMAWEPHRGSPFLGGITARRAIVASTIVGRLHTIHCAIHARIHKASTVNADLVGPAHRGIHALNAFEIIARARHIAPGRFTGSAVVGHGH